MPPPLRMYVDSWSINEIIKLYKKKMLVINPEYQRSKIWNSKKKAKLIDSILRGYSIGMLFFRKVEKRNRYIYEVLDGQQRINAIIDFVTSNLKTSPIYTSFFPNKTIEDLKRERENLYHDFLSYKIYYTMVEGGSDEEISDIFIRLQEGIKVNEAERLNAMKGVLRNFIFETCNTNKFFKLIGISPHRFNHRYVLAQLCLLSQEGDIESLSFPDLRFEKLAKLYRDYKLTIPPQLKKVKRILNFLAKHIGKDLNYIKKNRDVFPIYMVASYLQNYHINHTIIKKFKNFVVDFIINTTKIAKSKEDIEKLKMKYEPLLVDYSKIWAKYGLTEEAFRKRFEIALRYFLKYVPSDMLIPKEKRRTFDLIQKIEIYHKCKGKCYLCKKEVEWKDAVFHHKKFYKDGGKTTVKNGTLMHKKCHEEYHKTYGKDKEGY